LHVPITGRADVEIGLPALSLITLFFVAAMQILIQNAFGCLTVTR
jgi:hypothetical protein